MEFTWACILAAGLGVAVAYPSGSPPSACKGLLPKHGVSPSSNQSPYTITLSQSTYFPNQAVTVTISTSNAKTYPIMGFLLQGRQAQGNNHTSVGIFANPSGSTKLLTCTTNGDSFTHASAVARTTVQITWYPPSNNAGNIVISGSVAKSKEEFYGVLSSNPMSYSQAPQGTTSGPGTGGGGTGSGNYSMKPSSITAILIFVISALTIVFL